jgi:transcription elongation factor Elf1
VSGHLVAALPDYMCLTCGSLMQRIVDLKDPKTMQIHCHICHVTCELPVPTSVEAVIAPE